MDPCHLPKRFFDDPPVVVLMACCGAGRRPFGHQGQWPKRGIVYACQVLTDVQDREWVKVYGLETNQPFHHFERWRFRMVAEVWLN